MGDTFACLGRVNEDKATGIVTFDISSDLLAFQDAKLRDAVAASGGPKHLTVKEVESAPRPFGADADQLLLSAGQMMYVINEDDPSQQVLILTQRSVFIHNDPAKGVVSSPAAWQPPRGKISGPNTALVEGAEETFIYTEASEGSIRLNLLSPIYNGISGVDRAERQRQIEVYQDWQQSLGRNARFFPDEICIRDIPVSLKADAPFEMNTIVTRVNGLETERHTGFFYHENGRRDNSNSAEYVVPLQMTLPSAAFSRVQIMSLEPSPSKGVLVNPSDLFNMSVAPKKVSVEDVNAGRYGGLNRVLAAAVLANANSGRQLDRWVERSAQKPLKALSA